jgi:hypothetical protein
MTQYFILPGLGNSGELHWQTFFENTLHNCQRINQAEWDAPDCEEWLETIENVIKDYNFSNVVLIGHSLACVTIAHWAKKYGHHIKGALMVAPSDIESLRYEFPATGFTPIPLEKIVFKTVVVTSSNDEWVSLERAKYFADCWHSEFINIGEAGHINAASGFGAWQQGLDILKQI